MKWANLIPLLIFTALIVGVIFVVRPRARRSRHAAWEEAGLLPHQIDPHGPGDGESGKDEAPDTTERTDNSTDDGTDENGRPQSS